MWRLLHASTLLALNKLGHVVSCAHKELSGAPRIILWFPQGWLIGIRENVLNDEPNHRRTWGCILYLTLIGLYLLYCCADPGRSLIQTDRSAAHPKGIRSKSQNGGWFWTFLFYLNPRTSGSSNVNETWGQFLTVQMQKGQSISGGLVLVSPTTNMSRNKAIFYNGASITRS